LGPLIISHLSNHYILYFQGFEGADKFYIACQAPLADTIRDFWKMVWNEQTKIIIMLTGLTENGIVSICEGFVFHLHVLLFIFRYHA